MTLTVIETIFRALIGFSILLILTRILGVKQIGQLTFFTYITGIAMGNIAGDMVVHGDVSVAGGVTALIVWTFLTVVAEVVSLKSSRARVVLDGQPKIVIKNGAILREALRQARLNLDDLTMLLRNKNVFAIRDVDYAILEPNGELSVLKKPESEQPTKQDLQISTNPRAYLPTELIVDGKIVHRNLREWGLTEEWLDLQMKRSGITRIENILFAELQSDGTVYFEKMKR